MNSPSFKVETEVRITDSRGGVLFVRAANSWGVRGEWVEALEDPHNVEHLRVINDDKPDARLRFERNGRAKEIILVRTGLVVLVGQERPIINIGKFAKR